jgi:DNA polymerase I-like protein with 3'-5' exonuclease and polymerase domains
MKPELIVIDTLAGLKALGEYLYGKEYVAYDCETTGLTKRHEVIGFSVCAEQSKAFYVILHKFNGQLESISEEGYQEEAKLLIHYLKSFKLIMHNGIFDCMMAEAYFKVKLIDSLHTDTMILAHLLNENRRVGLKELGASMYGQDHTEEARLMKESVAKNGGTLTKDNYEMYKADSQLMGLYGAKDAWLTYKLFIDLVPELYEQGLDKFFYDDESMPMLRTVTYDLNTTGLQVDGKGLTHLKKQLEAECLEAKDFIYQEIAPYIKDKYPGTKKSNTFNIGASQQLAWLLFGKLELEFDKLTKGGKTKAKQLGLKVYTKAGKRAFITELTRLEGSIWKLGSVINGKTFKPVKYRGPWAYIAVDKTTLNKFAPKLKWVEKLLEYQKKQKILNTYVTGIEERTAYGIIQPSFLQHGTTSGRYSSRNPNFQNLPREDKRIKSIIIPRQGQAFIGADYSQLEPRVFAYYSKDAKLLEAFRGSDDFYSVIGMEVYQKFDCLPRKEGPESFGTKYKSLRDNAKTIALASTYGATAHQLAPTTGKSIEDTQQDIDNYFESFPGVAQMMLDSHELAKKNGQVTNIFGRPRRIPDAKKINALYGNTIHVDLPYEARKLLNLSVNHRIQSTAASIVNRAAIRLWHNLKKTGIDAKIVMQVHDSLIVEGNVADAENIALLLQDAMENTVQLEGIALEAKPIIGNSLAKV